MISSSPRHCWGFNYLNKSPETLCNVKTVKYRPVITRGNAKIPLHLEALIGKTSNDYKWINVTKWVGFENELNALKREI